MSIVDQNGITAYQFAVTLVTLQPSGTISGLTSCIVVDRLLAKAMCFMNTTP